MHRISLVLERNQESFEIAGRRRLRAVRRRWKGVLSLAVVALAWAGTAGVSAEPRVRPVYGDEALWGYWAFENDYLPKHDWKIVSVSQEGPGDRERSTNLIDDDHRTFYQPQDRDVYEVLIDLGRSRELGAFTILTLNRPSENVDSDIARYEVHVSDSQQIPGPAVAQGPFEAAFGRETIVTFPPSRGRYVTLKAYPRPNVGKTIAIREFSLVEAATVAKYEQERSAAVADRQAHWRDRNSEQAIAELGKDFLDLLFCDQADIHRANLLGRPKLEEIGKLKATGKYAEGLRVFREYYFDKLRRPQSFGLHAGDVHPYGRGFAGFCEFPQSPLNKDLDSDGQKTQVAIADDLMKGLMAIGNRKVNIGEPGTVDWLAPSPPYGYLNGAHAREPYRELWWGTGFQPLFAAYLVTKDEAYLKRWIAYMEDWAMNAAFLEEMHPVVNHDNSLYPVVTTIRMIASIAQTLPYDSDSVSPPALARIMRKLVLESPLNHIVYMRSNPNAWTPGAGLMLFAMLIDEFQVAPLYFRETRRRNIEDINAIQLLRDGTDPHQWPGYNPLVLINTGVLRLMNARENLPPWAQPAWERELHTPAWQRELTGTVGPARQLRPALGDTQRRVSAGNSPRTAQPTAEDARGLRPSACRARRSDQPQALRDPLLRWLRRRARVPGGLVPLRRVQHCAHGLGLGRRIRCPVLLTATWLWRIRHGAARTICSVWRPTGWTCWPTTWRTSGSGGPRPFPWMGDSNRSISTCRELAGLRATKAN